MIKSSPYLRWVREHPCLVCKNFGVDAHHPRSSVTGVPRGMSQRACGDDQAVPLCRNHHSMCHTFGDELTFWIKHYVDPIEWSERKWKEWKQQTSQSSLKRNS